MRVVRPHGTGTGRTIAVPPTDPAGTAGRRDTAPREIPAGHSRLPVPLDPPRRRPGLSRRPLSAPFIAQVIASAQPGVSSARLARRAPGAALAAYGAARALKQVPATGRHCDLSLD